MSFLGRLLFGSPQKRRAKAQSKRVVQNEDRRARLSAAKDHARDVAAQWGEDGAPFDRKRLVRDIRDGYRLPAYLAEEAVARAHAWDLYRKERRKAEDAEYRAMQHHQHEQRRALQEHKRRADEDMRRVEVARHERELRHGVQSERQRATQGVTRHSGTRAGHVTTSSRNALAAATSQEETYARLMALPPNERALALGQMADKGKAGLRRNPKPRRNPSTRSALSAAAGALANPRKRNPFMFEIVKGAVTGALASSLADEVKAARRKALGPPGTLPKKAPKRRRNPAVLKPNLPDAKLQRMSEEFHGRRGLIVELGEDQRRRPPKHVVLLGKEEALAYQPPPSSQRAGSWEHEAGDTGNRRVSGRPLVVADAEGRPYVIPGTSKMKFRADRGLVG